jgi:hypothetical protein
MQDDWLYHTTRANELRECHRVERWWADRDKLRGKPRILVDTLIDLFPLRGDPDIPHKRSENAVEDMLIDRLKVTHPGFTFKRSSLTTALAFVRDGKLPPKRRR